MNTDELLRVIHFLDDLQNDEDFLYFAESKNVDPSEFIELLVDYARFLDGDNKNER